MNENSIVRMKMVKRNLKVCVCAKSLCFGLNALG